MARTLLRVLVPAFAAGAIALSGAGAAFADEPASGEVSLDGVTTTEVVNVGGGTWDYGTTSSRGTWSNYYHGSRWHGSSAQGTYFDRSPCVRPGAWSRAWAPRASSGNRAWWRHC
ncbi:lactococcin 972 family bacteriocin [Nonomuraea longicatena]|uniref:Lactococcin 972 family bacteriocin n=1 Tax=Nonomuraea longicatena TaxID=83682 RepID=A0ABN1PBL3_9ACTN